MICGTPIGILSFEPVKNAEPAAFDLLVVDEVSKMTLFEFLAVAVKARRWVLVGDPAQLPPFVDCEENAATLDDLIPPVVALACTVATTMRFGERLAVVASDPPRAMSTIRSHLGLVSKNQSPSIALGTEQRPATITVCSPSEVPSGMRVLAERGISLSEFEPPQRAQASIFKNAFDAYHVQPWATKSRQRLAPAFRDALVRALPSTRAIDRRITGGVAAIVVAGGVRARSERDSEENPKSRLAHVITSPE